MKRLLLLLGPIVAIIGSVGIFMTGAGMLTVAGLVGFQPRPSALSGSRTAISVMLAIGSGVVGAISLLFLVSVWFHGTSLETMIADQSVSKPVELAEHLQTILNGTLLTFGGLATQGVCRFWLPSQWHRRQWMPGLTTEAGRRSVDE